MGCSGSKAAGGDTASADPDPVDRCGSSAFEDAPAGRAGSAAQLRAQELWRIGRDKVLVVVRERNAPLKEWFKAIDGLRVTRAKMISEGAVYLSTPLFSTRKRTRDPKALWRTAKKNVLALIRMRTHSLREWFKAVDGLGASRAQAIKSGPVYLSTPLFGAQAAAGSEATPTSPASLPQKLPFIPSLSQKECDTK